MDRTPLPGTSILSDRPGSFPWTVLHDRHPALLRQVLDGLPYPPKQRGAVEDLAREITGVIEPLSDAGPDAEVWAGWAAEYLGRSWYEVPFLWAENYFYRKLLAAVGYLEPGPGQGIDPFGPPKDAELRGSLVDQELAALDGLPALDPDDRGDALLLASLWGNRADLGFLLTSGSGSDRAGGSDRLVADDRAVFWQLLDAEHSGPVIVVADNAGRELLPDLVLIDHLLATGRAAEVVLQVKPRPYFISDATPADVLAALRRLIAGPAEAAAIGQRLWDALADGVLTIKADPFFVAPLAYPAMPDDLRADFAAAKLTIMKGDLNYRRLVDDRHWPATDSFAERTKHFPGPVVALRTLKSEVVVGLTEPALAALDAPATATPSSWRTSGTHALIQARP
jgi:Damage-control phosphatase ARMT1-like domain